ncbi:MAG: Dihydrodipicolinate synthase [Chloroflexi bacterium]|nr:Dihydrodipicolinate synthase [Chloroflexota bacterium]
MMSPVHDDGQLNYAATAALVHHLLAGRVDAILIAGTTGEFPCLSDITWATLVEAALGEINGAVPAIVNVSHCSVRLAIERAREAARSGATYVTSTPPFYVPLGHDDLVTYYHRLADASGVRLFLYNIPQFTQSDVTADLQRLAEHPNIVGIKESSGLYEGLASIPRRVNRPFIRLAGTDVLLPAAIAQGLDGVVPGLANVVPGLFHLWWNALRNGDAAAAQQHEEAIRRFTDLYATIPGTAPYMQVFRLGLRLLGIDPGNPSGIDITLADSVHREIQEALAHASRLVTQ